MSNVRPEYCVYLEDAYTGNSICCLETRSINMAINFIKTVNLEDVIVEFFRHHPFKKYDVMQILEVVKND